MNRIKTTLLAALMLSSVATFSACSDAKAQPETTAPATTTAVSGYNAVVTQQTQPSVTTVTSATETSEPAEDLTSVPQIRELMTNVNEKLSTVTSFSVTCDLTGKMCLGGSKNWALVNHTFTYRVADNISYLKSSTVNLDTSETSSYEEYKTLDKNVITILTKNEDNKWVNNTPKDILRGTITGDALANFGVIRSVTPLKTESGTVEPATVFSKAKIERTETGDITMTVDWIETAFVDAGHKPFNGLIRTPDITDTLGDLQSKGCLGSMTYVFDKDYMIKSVTFDAKDSLSQEGYDILCTLNFEWNDVNDLIAPMIVKENKTPEVTDATSVT